MILKKHYRYFVLAALCLLCNDCAYGQGFQIPRETPSFALKSNLLYDATATFNLGLEFKMAHKWTFDLPASYNPWTFNDNKKWRHILVQPAARWWTCEAFNGHFFGLHAHYAYYNVGNINTGIRKMPDEVHLKNLKDHRYEGWLAGAGVSYGYSAYLGKRFNLEFELGLGWAYLHYGKYRCAKCGEKTGTNHKNYFGPTKVAVSLVYLIR